MKLGAPVVSLVALLVLTSAPAFAEDTAVPASISFRAKKDHYLADKTPVPGDAAPTDADRAAWERSLDARVGKPPPPLVNVYNRHTREFLPLAVPSRTGRNTSKTVPTLSSAPKTTTDEFFRCHFTNEPTEMAPELVPLLAAAARNFRAERINVVSGFRSPKYNLILRKKGHEVARDSQHTHGRAVDFRIPGVPVDRVYGWVRSMRLGGVGVYRHSGFVHADTERVRYWSGR